MTELANENTPFFLDFAFEVPEHLEIESGNIGGDCVTWGEGGCDDD
jgi:hypothetical protein